MSLWSRYKAIPARQRIVIGVSGILFSLCGLYILEDPTQTVGASKKEFDQKHPSSSSSSSPPPSTSKQ